MKGLLLALVLIAAGIVGLGLYRGWFNLSSDKSESKPNVKFSYDSGKVKEDTDKTKEKLKPKERTSDKAEEQERRP
jgi:hypothetical protein